MSEPMQAVDEVLWEQYLSECRATETRPTLSDYSVYLSDRDEPTEDWAVGEGDVA